MRDTWWLWLLIFGASLLMAIFVTRIYFILMPLLVVSMIYFALMRYDKDGKNIGDSGDQLG